MFVPVHRRRAAAAGKNAQVKIKPAVVMAAATAAVGGVVSNLLRAGWGAGGKRVAVGLVIGIGAALLGLALARAVGRQGRI